jgi:hypothetical protein
MRGPGVRFLARILFGISAPIVISFLVFRSGAIEQAAAGEGKGELCGAPGRALEELTRTVADGFPHMERQAGTSLVSASALPPGFDKCDFLDHEDQYHQISCISPRQESSSAAADVALKLTKVIERCWGEEPSVISTSFNSSPIEHLSYHFGDDVNVVVDTQSGEESGWRVSLTVSWGTSSVAGLFGRSTAPIKKPLRVRNTGAVPGPGRTWFDEGAVCADLEFVIGYLGRGEVSELRGGVLGEKWYARFDLLKGGCNVGKRHYNCESRSVEYHALALGDYQDIAGTVRGCLTSAGDWAVEDHSMLSECSKENLKDGARCETWIANAGTRLDVIVSMNEFEERFYSELHIQPRR